MPLCSYLPCALCTYALMPCALVRSVFSAVNFKLTAIVLPFSLLLFISLRDTLHASRFTNYALVQSVFTEIIFKLSAIVLPFSLLLFISLRDTLHASRFTNYALVHLCSYALCSYAICVLRDYFWIFSYGFTFFIFTFYFIPSSGPLFLAPSIRLGPDFL